MSLQVDDPTGNSYVENLNAPKTDPQLLLTTFHRTKQQNQSLGFQDNSIEEEGGEENLREEVLQFNTICDQCSRPSVTKMKVTLIPHFKEVVIMATECDSCGYKTNEVKSGGGIEPLGKKYSLEVRSREDLHRDVLKSETCSISIPELDLDIGSGIFVGKFTTVEGILTDVKEDLLKNPFLMGDATTDDKKIKIQNISKKIQEVINGTTSAHLNLDDPAGNSFVQDIYTPLEDPCLRVEQYERSFEQNEELGLNDMKTENYGEDS
ncbi:UNVERIFIED_CONTAM: hypothetical protein GTU68_022444 [Idotea baltica]|nr:hypothetical protein [Idotea baltica]